MVSSFSVSSSLSNNSSILSSALSNAGILSAKGSNKLRFRSSMLLPTKTPGIRMKPIFSSIGFFDSGVAARVSPGLVIVTCLEIEIWSYSRVVALTLIMSVSWATNVTLILPLASVVWDICWISAPWISQFTPTLLNGTSKILASKTKSKASPATIEFTVDMISDGFVSTVFTVNFDRGKSLAKTEISVSSGFSGMISKSTLYSPFGMVMVCGIVMLSSFAAILNSISLLAKIGLSPSSKICKANLFFIPDNRWSGYASSILVGFVSPKLKSIFAVNPFASKSNFVFPSLIACEDNKATDWPSLIVWTGAFTNSFGIITTLDVSGKYQLAPSKSSRYTAIGKSVFGITFSIKGSAAKPNSCFSGP